MKIGFLEPDRYGIEFVGNNGEIVRIMAQTDSERYETVERYIRQLRTNEQKVALVAAINELFVAYDAAVARANIAAAREGMIEQEGGWRSVKTDPPPIGIPIEIICTAGVRLEDGYILPGDEDGEPVGVQSVIKWRPNVRVAFV